MTHLGKYILCYLNAKYNSNTTEKSNILQIEYIVLCFIWLFTFSFELCFKLYLQIGYLLSILLVVKCKVIFGIFVHCMVTQSIIQLAQYQLIITSISEWANATHVVWSQAKLLQSANGNHLSGAITIYIISHPLIGYLTWYAFFFLLLLLLLRLSIIVDNIYIFVVIFVPNHRVIAALHPKIHNKIGKRSLTDLWRQSYWRIDWWRTPAYQCATRGGVIPCDT